MRPAVRAASSHRKASARRVFSSTSPQRALRLCHIVQVQDVHLRVQATQASSSDEHQAQNIYPAAAEYEECYKSPSMHDAHIYWSFMTSDAWHVSTWVER